MATLSAQAAGWVTRTTLGEVPRDVIEHTKLRILDLVGVMLAASPLEAVAAARRAVTETDGGGGAAILGCPDETSLTAAAFVNGVMSAILEFDDTHIETNIHPTGPALAAALPLCHSRGLSGAQLVEAVLIGSELCCRLGRVAPVRMHELGFHPTAVYGIFGAVYAIAKARRLAVGQIIDAIGTAASMSSGLISSFEDGTATKTMHVGMAAASALRAVALATHGITGPSAVFEGRFGWFRSFVQTTRDFNFNAVTDGLGSDWQVLNIASKFYPCAFTMMPHIAAALALRAEHNFDLGEIIEVQCHIMPRSFPIVCEPVEDKRRPATSWHGRISLQHTVAEALVLGRMDKNAYAPRSLRDPQINALADKVRHLADHEAMTNLQRSRGTVTIVLRDGRTLSHTIADMPGTRHNPIATADYVAKFRANVDGVLTPDVADEAIETLLALERVDDVTRLFDRLCRRQPR